MTPNDRILSFVSSCLPADFLPGPEAPFVRGQFLKKFASAKRALGTAPLPESAELLATTCPWLLAGAPKDEVARIALLLDADTRLLSDEMLELAEDCFRHGDNAERRAVLRSLSLFQEPSRYVELGAQACRSHVQTVFDALACENPFPAEFFPDLNFNQMILKALFTEASLERVMGLAARVTPELSRMASDYAAERRAAGRVVPADIARIIP